MRASIRPQSPPGLTLCVLGGDERERVLLLTLAARGYAVRACGRSLGPEEAAAGVLDVPASEAFHGDVIIAPLAGVSDEGTVYSRPPHAGLTVRSASLPAAERPRLWLGGAVSPVLRAQLERAGFELLDLAAEDELATLNTIPTAEGAIQLAMQGSPFCLHGALSVVLGFGRTGQTLALMLRGLGARVLVCARNAAARARAFAAGHEASDFAQLKDRVGEALFCFNTVPAPVLSREVLARASRDLTIVDLASRPGGTDFAAAAELGIRATLAPGLPGLVAPRTAGAMLCQVILRLIEGWGHGTRG